MEPGENTNINSLTTICVVFPSPSPIQCLRNMAPGAVPRPPPPVPLAMRPSLVQKGNELGLPKTATHLGRMPLNRHGWVCITDAACSLLIAWTGGLSAGLLRGRCWAMRRGIWVDGWQRVWGAASAVG